MDGLTEGRIVHYILDNQDVARIQEQRKVAGNSAHGNYIEVGEHLPMMIVRVWDKNIGYVNGQVFLDGNDTLWVTSVDYHEPMKEMREEGKLDWYELASPRTWHWIEKA